jgi:hypothetical protein
MRVFVCVCEESERERERRKKLKERMFKTGVGEERIK